jgi:GntR family transcriptional regulator/MocR family aminotransferase
MLSELIYEEGEIHRLPKKNILIYKQRRRFFYTNVLKKILKMLFVLKKPTGGWQYGYSLIP